jgi:hypothetical protein
VNESTFVNRNFDDLSIVLFRYLLLYAVRTINCHVYPCMFPSASIQGVGPDYLELESDRRVATNGAARALNEVQIEAEYGCIECARETRRRSYRKNRSQGPVQKNINVDG